MTQMLLFDFATTAASPVPVTAPPALRRSAERQSTRPAKAGARVAAANRRKREQSAPAVAGGSLPLYDPAQGELHRIGDLAQLVLARYDIVHRRRAARLRREAAARCAG